MTTKTALATGTGQGCPFGCGVNHRKGTKLGPHNCTSYPRETGDVASRHSAAIQVPTRTRTVLSDDIDAESEEMVPHQMFVDGNLARLRQNKRRFDADAENGISGAAKRSEACQQIIDFMETKPSRDQLIAHADSGDAGPYASYYRDMAKNMDDTREMMSRPATGVQTENAAQALRLPPGTRITCVGHSFGPGRIVGKPGEVVDKSGSSLLIRREGSDEWPSYLDIKASEFTAVPDGFRIEKGEPGTTGYIAMQYRFC